MNESINFRDYLLSEPPEFQAEVERNAQKLIEQVEDLKAIRKIVEMSQTDIALRTLRRFVEHIGGELDIVSRLPGHPHIRLNKLPDEGVVDFPAHHNKLAVNAR